MIRIPKRVTLVAGVVALVILVFFAVPLITNHQPLTTRGGSAQAAYYCPMHPTYTSDRPGDCPICNMKLLKREPQASPAQRSPVTTQPKNFATICYLHNCEKIHEGTPCPMTVVAKPGEKVTCPVCGTHIAEASTPPSERTILYWTDPMIPGFKADGPGKSPMGMDLVPVYEEETPSASAATPEGYAPILLTPEKQQLVGVTSAQAARRATTKTIRAVGIIAHDPELYQAQQEFLQAQQAWQKMQAGGIPEVVEQAKRLADSSRLRLRHLGLSDEMIDEVGTWTQPDHRLLLGGAGQFWVYTSIYEYELSLVHAGQAATISVDAFHGRAFSGTVKAIDPMLDAATRTTRVRILVEDPDGILKPEMFVNVSIAVDLGTLLTVPQEAIFSTGQRQIVFVDQGQGLFEPRQVTTGVNADGYTEIKDGLNEGERVVTSGNFLIDSESRLKGALQKSGGSHQHGP
ncbi:MAG: efflux RND transporter periplasmic adaptor subunit [Candidatus Omnitrophota bacterium]|nr:efflux RND transporter periplasmic adaptor subunit [Candidatus Omnitrophota bacterium]